MLFSTVVSLGAAPARVHDGTDLPSYTRSGLAFQRRNYCTHLRKRCQQQMCVYHSVQKRDAIAKQLLARASAAAAKPGKGKTVYRNLRDGDLMLTNRQPTLHKPGMMAHRARVLKVTPVQLALSR